MSEEREQNLRFGQHNGLRLATITLLVATSLSIHSAYAASAGRAPSIAGWAPSQLITPEKLVKEMAITGSRKPVIICVGFRVLYRGAHIKGAQYEGAASEPSGMARLRAWARSLPKATTVVIYCGCCPFSECPNVRPAFAALRNEGILHIRVLYLEHGFARDWVEKGYPSQREKQAPRASR